MGLYGCLLRAVRTVGSHGPYGQCVSALRHVAARQTEREREREKKKKKWLDTEQLKTATPAAQWLNSPAVHCELAQA